MPWGLASPRGCSSAWRSWCCGRGERTLRASPSLNLRPPERRSEKRLSSKRPGLERGSPLRRSLKRLSSERRSSERRSPSRRSSERRLSNRRSPSRRSKRPDDLDGSLGPPRNAPFLPCPRRRKSPSRDSRQGDSERLSSPSLRRDPVGLPSKLGRRPRGPPRDGRPPAASPPREGRGGRRSKRELMESMVMTGLFRSPRVDPEAGQAASDSAERASQPLSQIPWPSHKQRGQRHGDPGLLGCAHGARDPFPRR